LILRHHPRDVCFAIFCHFKKGSNGFLVRTGSRKTAAPLDPQSHIGQRCLVHIAPKAG